MDTTKSNGNQDLEGRESLEEQAVTKGTKSLKTHASGLASVQNTNSLHLERWTFDAD